jgi:uncharacterized protein (DUF1800 family)
MRYSASLAASRFGLGARPGEIELASSDPVGWLTAQIKDANQSGPAGPSSVEAATRFAEWRALKQAARSAGEAVMLDEKNPARVIFREECSNALAYAAVTETPITERLTLFWQNHFCIAAQKPAVTALAGAYVREAVRPHVNGRFANMLRASAKHPAMLEYLDNRNSIGPNSKAGQKRSKGLNENLAREILELHTLGVDGGYTPADVTSFAKLITGWSSGAKADDPDIGLFKFKPQTHEPGPITIMDQKWADTGLEEGEAFLEYLGTQPKTAKHIAMKLAQHFVADDPPASLVSAIEAAFLKTGGELSACYEVMLTHEAAWQPDTAKFRTPQSFLLAALRGLAVDLKPNQILQSLNVMGQPLWRAPSPKGWPDLSSTWMASAAMKTRLDFASTLATRAKPSGSGTLLELASDLLGDRLTDETSTALLRAADNKQALTLLLMSPEFQRS